MTGNAMRVAWTVPLVFLGLLSACTHPQKPQAETPPLFEEIHVAEPASSISRTADVVPDPAPQVKPTEAERRERQLRDAQEAQQALDAAAAEASKPDLASLVGRDFAGVEQMLGPADGVSEAPPAREWEYNVGTCRLVIRFYPDLKTLAYSVLSYSVIDDSVALKGVRTDGASNNGTVIHDGTHTNGVAAPVDAAALQDQAVRDKRCRDRISTRIRPAS